MYAALNPTLQETVASWQVLPQRRDLFAPSLRRHRRAGLTESRGLGTFSGKI
jgi:hypothetical protein